MSMNHSEIIRGILSLELRGLIFFALALLVVFFLRKRSARIVAACWRSVFAAATVMIALGFANPMLVMELLGRDMDQKNEKITSSAIPNSELAVSSAVASHNEVEVAPASQIVESPLNVEVGPGEESWMNWKTTILALWILGMVILLFSPLTGLLGLARLYRQSESGEDTLMKKFTQACQQAGVGSLKLRELQAVDGVPFVAGVLRPTLFVPAGACDWDRADWEIVLRHEVAHVRHLDGFFNFLAQLCLAAYWVNPLAWIAYRQLKTSQECADDYADALLKFCAQSVNPPSMAMQMARPSTMRVRIERILDGSRRRAADQAESRYEVEWLSRFADLPFISSPLQKADLKIEGSLRPLNDQAFTELTSEDFTVRAKAQKLLNKLEAQTTYLLEVFYKQSTDDEHYSRVK